MWYKNIAGRFFGLVTKHACERQTDGRTDGQNYDSQDRASIAASRGNDGPSTRVLSIRTTCVPCEHAPFQAVFPGGQKCLCTSSTPVFADHVHVACKHGLRTEPCPKRQHVGHVNTVSVYLPLGKLWNIYVNLQTPAVWIQKEQQLQQRPFYVHGGH